MPAYATRSPDGPYHIVEQRVDLTLCGQKISKIQNGGGNGTLSIVKEKPAQARLCKHCERLRAGNESIELAPQSEEYDPRKVTK